MTLETRRDRAAATRRALLPVLLAVVLLVPNQFSVFAGGVLLTPLRIFLILAMAPTLMAYLRRGVTGYDIVFFLFVAWTVLATFIKYGITGSPFGNGIEIAGQFTLESMGIYLLCVAYIRSVDDITAIIRIFTMGCLILLPFAVVEALGDTHYLQDLLNRVTGSTPLEGTIAGERLGLLRVTSIFPHPILFGVFCATTLSMMWMTEKSAVRRLFFTAVITVTTFLSLSSAPLLVVAIQFACLATERATRWLKHRFSLIMAGVASVILAAGLLTSRGVFGLIVLITFSAGTAYHRRAIWVHGMENVRASPVFGIIPDLWRRPAWMSPSIDNQWLLQTMVGGVPSVLFLAAALIWLTVTLFRAPDSALPDDMARLRRGWAYSFLALVLAGATVALFGKAQPFMYLVVGMGAALTRLVVEAAARTPVAAAAAPPPAAPRRRPALEPARIRRGPVLR